MTNNQKPWYESIQKIEVPVFINNLKELIKEKFTLIKQKNELIKRLEQGIDFFSDSTKDRQQLILGGKQFKSICEDIVTIEKRVIDIETEITAILEAKLSDFGFIINLALGENENDETVSSRQINCVPWREVLNNEDKIIMTPEQIWYFGMARKLFNVNPNNIEFLSSDIFKGE